MASEWLSNFLNNRSPAVTVSVNSGGVADDKAKWWDVFREVIGVSAGMPNEPKDGETPAQLAARIAADFADAAIEESKKRFP